MPSNDVSFSSNAAELAGRLNRLAGRLEDPAPVLEAARRLIGAQEQAVWATEGGVLGTHWAAAAESSRKNDSRLLVATGALRNSLTSGDQARVDGTQLRLGTNVPYGVYHQYGTSRMPARQFLGIAPELANQLLELFQRSVDDEL